MASGVAVSGTCREIFDKLKFKKNIPYIIYKIENDKTVVVDKQGEPVDGESPEATHARFVADMPNDQPRYAVCDFKFTNAEGIPQDKIILVYWSPDDKANRKDKMLYASTKDAIRKALNFSKDCQCNDYDDLSYATLLEKHQR